MNTSDAEKPPHVRPRLKQAPKVRDMLWCDFPKDAHLPEMWKRRPVIVIATDRSLGGAVTVVPCSSQDQAGNKWAVRLDTPIDGKGPSWAICDKPTTVAVSRLSLQDNSRHRCPRPSSRRCSRSCGGGFQRPGLSRPDPAAGEGQPVTERTQNVDV